MDHHRADARAARGLAYFDRFGFSVLDVRVLSGIFARITTQLAVGIVCGVLGTLRWAGLPGKGPFAMATSACLLRSSR